MKPSQGVIGSSFTIVVLVAAGVVSLSARAAESEAGARRHAAKASQLAAKNKCKSALPEFTRAYKSLKDPTLLFNRAECYRKVGRDGEALKDYEQFLAEMPEAPNRASVEARIAALRGATPVSGEAAPAAGKEPAAEVAKERAAAAVKPATAVGKEPAAPAAKPAVMGAKQPAALAAKPADKPPVVPVAKPAAPPAAVPVAKPAATGAKEPVAPVAKPAETQPAAPVRRAEKWTD
jgi:hypothetical protein